MGQIDSPAPEQTEPPAPRVLSVIQAAELLGCSRMHVYRLIEAGEFPILDIRSPGSTMPKTRIWESDLLDYLARASAR